MFFYPPNSYKLGQAETRSQSTDERDVVSVEEARKKKQRKRRSRPKERREAYRTDESSGKGKGKKAWRKRRTPKQKELRKQCGQQIMRTKGEDEEKEEHEQDERVQVASNMGRVAHTLRPRQT